MMQDSSKMIQLAVKALDNAYAPYSKFHVAACIRATDGNYYTGVNIENASYGLTLCAEMAAIASFINAGNTLIKDIVILSNEQQECPPCGACRQRIAEFSNESTRIHLADHNQILHSYTIEQLLPYAFKFTPPSP